MFKTIVVGHDGSEAAAGSLSAATEIAKSDGAKLVVAHVDEHLVGKGAGMSVKADEEEVRAALERQVKELASGGLDAQLVAKEMMLGGPAHQIAEVAEETGADLIVVGNRGHSTVTGLLLGSVTHRLLHIATVPVLVVPDKR